MMSDIRRYMPQLVTGLPGQRSLTGVAMVEVSDGGYGWVELAEHERALAKEARWAALEAVARSERDGARDQLAAKDREIAERDEMIRRLLENRGMRAAIERHEEFAAAALAAISGAGISTPVEGYMKSPGLLPNDIRALAAERDVAQDRAEKAESECDEARECVGRLYGILRLLYMSAEIAPGFWDEALAATPEHLRGAVANGLTAAQQ